MDEFHTFITNQHTKLKFTVEIETNKKCIFLDLTLNRNRKSITLEFSIYHNPTHTLRIIPYSSNHCISHKRPALISNLLKLINTPTSKVEYKKEINIIQQIAFANGYSKDVVGCIFNKMTNKQPTEDSSCWYLVVLITLNNSKNLEKSRYDSIKFVDDSSSYF